MTAVKHLLLVCIFAAFFSIPSSAQNQALADSLLAVLNGNTELSDSAKYVLLSDISLHSTRPADAIEYSRSAIALAREQQLNVNIARPLLLYGHALMLTGDLVTALQSFFEAAKLYEQLGNTSGVATAYLNIAQAYRTQQHAELALTYQQKAISVFRAAKDTVRLSSALLNLGYQYYKDNAPDSAIVYSLEAGRLARAVDHQIVVAYALGNAGLAYATLQKDALAEARLEEAIALLEKNQDSYAIAEYQSELAAIYQKQGSSTKALTYAHAAYKVAQQHGYKELLQNISQVLAEIYSSLNKYKEAYQYQRLYTTYRDSIVNEETVRQMADMRTAFEVAQKQDEVDDLTREKKNQQYLLAGIAIICLLAIVLLIVLWRYSKHKQVANQLLKQQNEVLEQQRRELEALITTRNRFFSIISHDLRGPVNAFNGISSLIRHYISVKDMTQLAEVSEYIDKSASQLASLLENLLSWAVIQQGEFPYQPEEVRPAGMGQDIVAMFQPMAHAKHIHLESFIDKELVLWVDANSLLTILRNLTSNALKFTREGGTVIISAEQKGAFVEIQVADTGIGMPQERLDALFTIRDEKRTWGTAGEKGLGIGLRLVYDFVEMNKGSVIVKSQEGIGTTFTVKLPVAPPQPKETKGLLNQNS